MGQLVLRAPKAQQVKKENKAPKAQLVKKERLEQLVKMV